MTSRVLRIFGRLQRPIAWSIMLAGVVSFFVVLLNIIATGEAKLATLLGAVLVWNDGFQAIQVVENALESEGSPNGSNTYSEGPAER